MDQCNSEDESDSDFMEPSVDNSNKDTISYTGFSEDGKEDGSEKKEKKTDQKACLNMTVFKSLSISFQKVQKKQQ